MSDLCIGNSRYISLKMDLGLGRIHIMSWKSGYLLLVNLKAHSGLARRVKSHPTRFTNMKVSPYSNMPLIILDLHTLYPSRARRLEPHIARETKKIKPRFVYKSLSCLWTFRWTFGYCIQVLIFSLWGWNYTSNYAFWLD